MMDPMVDYRDEEKSKRDFMYSHSDRLGAQHRHSRDFTHSHSDGLRAEHWESRHLTHGHSEGLRAQHRANSRMLSERKLCRKEWLGEL